MRSDRHRVGVKAAGRDRYQSVQRGFQDCRQRGAGQPYAARNAVEIQRQAERERVARETELPIDACGASGSNYAASAVRHTQMAASRYRRGGASTSNRALNVALNQPAPAIDASRQTTATIHLAHYCSAIEAKLGYCTASTLPDGDTDAASLFTGAGKPDKPADLTFTPEQIDAARAYARLALDPNPPEHIT